MSFFHCFFHIHKAEEKREAAKKYVADTMVLWLFVLFLTASCVFIYQGEKNLRQEGKEIYTYHLDLDENTEDLVETAADTSVLSKLYARYALLMDASNRRVLYEKDGYTQAAMASTTKIMTLLVTLENANLDDMVTVSGYAASMPDVKLGMKKGDRYQLRDLLYSLMLESHNDTAVAIAEHVGGSVEGFAAMMNEKAGELGAYDTHFVTPNGLDAEGHCTTAYDLALIASYAIENADFLDIIKTASHTFQEQESGRSYTVNNKDRFLTSYDGAIGIKTGFTGNAGYCFVGAVGREDRRLVSVVLASGWPPNKTYKWTDTTKLMDYGVNEYEPKEILAENTAFQPVEVTDSIEEMPVTPYVKESVSLLLKEGEQVSYDIKVPASLEAPVKKEETIGEVTIKINDEVYKVLPLYAKEERIRITYSYILKGILYRYFCSGFLK